MRFRLTNLSSWAFEFDANSSLELQQAARAACAAFSAAGPSGGVGLHLHVQSEVEPWLWLKGKSLDGPGVARQISDDDAERLFAAAQRSIAYDRSMWSSVDEDSVDYDA